MNHKDLDVWKEAMQLVELIYKFSNLLPDDEKFGLISQVRRAAVSIPSNIAEGAARKSNKEFLQFCFISLGSMSELETQLILSKNLFKLPVDNELEKLESCRKVLSGLIRYLKSKN